MPQPRKITPGAMALLRAEAHRRAEIRAELHSNKQLARLTGLAPGYVAQLVAQFRREIETQAIDVSRETKSE